MGDSKDKPVVGRGNSAGHVEVDSRGRNVWQWNDARIDIDSTTILLKRLDNDALALEPTQSVPIPKQSGAAAKRAARRASQDDEWSLSESVRIDVGGSFDPYNSST